MATVKVAVRVRPLNSREVNLNAQPIIEMDGKKTRICNSKVAASKLEGEAIREKYKDFTFDYSYWSYDEMDQHFASQEQVFKDLGMDVVDNAFQGYNACVFAYGQTGSGKTHTMMGAPAPPEAQGLIPRICKDMFNRMHQGKEKGTTYRTEVSYLEIYNERVKDLLKGDQTHSLKVREHPKQGPYVEGLSKHLVMDYDDIVGLMARGNANRTTASTNMNDVSSRSHAIFTMTFVQASFVGDMPSETVSKVHLVDLAGSERADASGATGARLKEGAHINKSLVTLGSVISALADASAIQSQTHSQKKVFIPYRDSVLTWLLKDSLGGNAKTIMIATISPADCNYGETLSTLRYANRAKNIINKPTINEDPNVKLIRDLRSEIQKLKSMLGSEDGSEVLAELLKKEAKEKSLTEEWTDKWKETQKILMEQKDLTLRKAGPGVILDSQMPHLIGIDDDLHSTGITLYHLKEGETKIGSNESNADNQDITLKGQGLESQHCSILLENGQATLIPNNGAVCSVNGQHIDKPTRLFQGCVLLLGRTNMFRYNDPVEAEKMRREGSKSQVNLNRLSFLSRSASDLAWSESTLNISVNGEENTILEEKRRQLEMEEARLQKESQALMEQKKLLEEQKQSYQQLQLEKEEAWKAEQLNKSSVIQQAQKELEDRRKKLEVEYTAHRRRLAEDWKRLEQQEQETLASLQSKEKDLKKRRELLEIEIDQEMEQIETEAQKIEYLRTELEIKQQEVDKFVENLASELQEKLGKSAEELKPLLMMDEPKFKEYFQSQKKNVDDIRTSTISKLNEQRETILSQINDFSEKLKHCSDEKEKLAYEKEQESLSKQAEGIQTEIDNVESNFNKESQLLQHTAETLKESRADLLSKNRECSLVEQEVEQSLVKIIASEDKMSRLESDLALIADQEKLIVTQLAHIDTSKQKLKTIIENTGEGKEMEDVDELKKALTLNINEGGLGQGQDSCSITSDNNESNQMWEQENNKLKLQPQSSSPLNTRDNSPNRVERNNDVNSSLKCEDISPIKPPSDTKFLTSSNFSTSPTEITLELKRLVEQINDQKTVVLECLENDCDKEELNNHMAVLQELRNRYLQIECLLDGGRHKFLGYDEDDSTFEFDKNEDSTMANDSELDDSEIQSSVTDNDDLQAIIDQEVEKRLKEIFHQLKDGQSKSNIFLRQQPRANLRNSLPSGLNHLNGSGSEDEGSNSPNIHLPRSISMNSGAWTCFAQGGGVIPGILDVSIPSFVLRGNGTSTHYEYEVTIITPTERWSVLRRYQRFRDLFSHMRKKYGHKIENIHFPPKKLFGRRSEKLAKERQKLLEVFLQTLLKSCAQIHTCPLHNCNAYKIKDALAAFSPFFQKGIFESTIYGTS